MTVWQLTDLGPVSANDDFALGPDFASSHTYPPPGYTPAAAPRECVTTRPVPRTFRDGLLIIPETLDREEPWSRLDLLVDVLRKRRDLSTPGPPPTWTMRPEAGKGMDTWTYLLECPLDWSWVLAHALLPDNISLHDGPGLTAPVAGDLMFMVTAPERPDARRWVDAGWVQGQPFDGPFPQSPRAAQEHKEAVRRQRRAQGRRWWQR